MITLAIKGWVRRTNSRQCSSASVLRQSCSSSRIGLSSCAIRPFNRESKFYSVPSRTFEFYDFVLTEQICIYRQEKCRLFVINGLEDLTHAEGRASPAHQKMSYRSNVWKAWRSQLRHRHT